ncbi:MAG: hypothetical protein V5A38_07530 [Halolamina sp.]|uniref:DUF7310 family coiled-coil domain-containing protein n=1 Tax=Halolamina sp. TaxID=1940283 RepID=UPI002FC3624F
MSSNSDERALERRLAAVERAVDGSEREFSEATDPPSPERESLEHRHETLENRVDELDAALQAVRGFLGGIDAVNEAVESRADAAIAAVDRLERQLDEISEERDQRELHNRRGRPDAGVESDVDELSSNGGGETASEGDEESHSGHEAPVSENDPNADDTADDADRPLRERLNQQW